KWKSTSHNALRTNGITAVTLRTSPPQSLDIPAILIRGPPSVVSPHRLRRLDLDSHRFSRLSGFFAFGIESSGDGGWTAALRNGAHCNDVMIGAEPNVQLVADL